MGRPRKLSAEQEQEVWNLHVEGLTPAKIAKQLNLSYMLVYTSLKREKNATRTTTETTKSPV